jgi:tight adherence protein B
VRPRGLARLAAVVAALALTTIAAPAFADEGSIDHVETSGGKLQILYSLPGAGDVAPDMRTLKVSLNGKSLPATATLASDAAHAVRRTAILAIDVSDSMAAGGKFAQAKTAADVFLDSVPKDLYVGVVTFAGKVTVAQQPTLDRASTKAVVNGLTVSRGTQLYNGLLKATSIGDSTGQRSVIVLSDGRDTSGQPLTKVTPVIKRSGAKVDVVALAQSAADVTTYLQPLSDAGHGTVITASDPKGLGQVFASEAAELAKQVQITAPAPTDGTKEGTIAVSLAAAGTTYDDSAFVPLSSGSGITPAVQPSTDLSVAPAGFSVSKRVMEEGLAAFALGLLVIIVGIFGGFGKPKETIESHIDAYTHRGRSKRASTAPAAGNQGVAAQAVGFATKALESNHDFETKVGDRLEGAGLALKPAEWLLVQGGIAMAAAAMLFAFTGGNILFGAVGLVVGALLPWMWLGFKRSRRLKAFNGQLAGCLQLMAGSMQAGLSLAQALDTVVREGQEPLSGEFRRALVETRLGVPIEAALESIGDRMESPDFQWTVMAIKIQREVGGNLSELLLNVASTLREREYLRRQVKALSAEGRFSAYILLALPPAIMLYMTVTNPTYLHPLLHTHTGYFMLGVMVVLMVLGYYMMKKMIKVEV